MGAVIGEITKVLGPTAKRGVITDTAQALQQLIDGIDHVLHPDATATKRDLIDVAHTIEGVLGEITKILGPTTKRGIIADLANQIQSVVDGIDHVLHPDATVTKRDLVDIAHTIVGIVGELSNLLTPTTTKRGIITDVATSLQQVIDGIDHVLHPDATVTKRDLIDIAHQIEGIVGELSKILTPTAKRGIIT